jgi:hypothetical protein
VADQHGLVSCEKEKLSQPTLQLNFNTVTSDTSLKSASANSIQFTSGHIILESMNFKQNQILIQLK